MPDSQPPASDPVELHARGFGESVYQLTAKSFSSQRTEDALKETAGQIERSLDQEVGQNALRVAPDYKAACKPGCDHCCYLTFSASIPEIAVVVDYVRSRFGDEEMGRLRARLEVHKGSVGSGSSVETAQTRAACPLLENGLCSAYEARPFRCRVWNSIDAAVCLRKREDPQNHEPLPAVPGQLRLGLAARRGLSSGMARVGLGGSEVEFGTALAIALDNPQAVEDYLANKQVFAPASMETSPASTNAAQTPEIALDQGPLAQARRMSEAARRSRSPHQLIESGDLLASNGDPQGAAENARMCLKIDPKSASAHLVLCRALIEMNQSDEAAQHLQKAVELGAERLSPAYLGLRQLTLGQIDEAVHTLRGAVKRNPRDVEAFRLLMFSQKVSEIDRPIIEAAQKVRQSADLTPAAKSEIHFGLGKALEDLGEYEQAMQNYDQANSILKQQNMGERTFDRKAYSRRVDQLMASYRSVAKAGHLGGIPLSELPLLVLGMMRSGTTLVDQILSCHPEVESGGELTFWSDNDAALLEADPAKIQNLGNDYLNLLQSIGPNAVRVTDKLPGNYEFAPFISFALPKARFIHVRRNPLDTCLSIWTNPFGYVPVGAYDKSTMVFVYKEYLRLAEHLLRSIPQSNLLEVDYEELVSDREDQIKRMLEFLGLPWNVDCLSPERKKGVINTASFWQARQPINTSSIGRWRRFEPWLGELAELR